MGIVLFSSLRTTFSKFVNPTLIKKQYYANGKLLLAGEYAVLDGATAFAVPTKLGQKMIVKNSRGSDLVWECIDHQGNTWFSSHISLYDFSPINTTDEAISDKLQNILKNAVRQNSEFLSKWNGFKVECHLEFPTNWGLGSSSSLYQLVAEWADVNALLLYFKVETGSGYDVACAGAGTPILYFANDDEVSYTPVEFLPLFRKDLYFVHLNEKKDSSIGIKEYLKVVKKKEQFVLDATSISESMTECSDLKSFASLMDKHEDLVHHHTGFTKVKDAHFSDYSGSIKSLGAWGGDFVMATGLSSAADTKKYFADLGYKTILSYEEMIG